MRLYMELICWDLIRKWMRCRPMRHQNQLNSTRMMMTSLRVQPVSRKVICSNIWRTWAIHQLKSKCCEPPTSQAVVLQWCHPALPWMRDFSAQLRLFWQNTGTVCQLLCQRSSCLLKVNGFGGTQSTTYNCWNLILLTDHMDSGLWIGYLLTWWDRLIVNI